jgi:hypothetical protein
MTTVNEKWKIPFRFEFGKVMVDEGTGNFALERRKDCYGNKIYFYFLKIQYAINLNTQNC